jgi:hypothetical protein
MWNIRGKARRNEPLEKPRCRWVNNIRTDLERQDEMKWTGSIWLRIETSGGLL